MRIKILNERQFECTVSKEELEEYGLTKENVTRCPDKMQELLSDMLEQAEEENGFETEENGEMQVEMVLLPSGGAMLTATDIGYDGEDGDDIEIVNEGEVGFADFLDCLAETIRGMAETETETKTGKKREVIGTGRMFAFSDLEDGIRAASVIGHAFKGESALYREPGRGDYLLTLNCGGQDVDAFLRAAHAVAGYLEERKCIPGTEAYCKEHCKTVIADNAVGVLASLDRMFQSTGRN